MFDFQTCYGKLFSRELNRNDITVLKFKEVDKNHEIIKRFRRETSGGEADQFSHSAVTGNLTSTTFVIPDKLHTQAVVQWAGPQSDVSIDLYT